ncbi:MAG: arylesterase [Desulfuromonas sp.]|nr:MAG: arylesterase [Desulfuromonas sp.]
MAILTVIGGWSQTNAAETPVRIVVFGDSLAAGYRLPLLDAFPSRLQAALRQAGREAMVINSGVSGDTTAGGLARINWMLADQPDLVIVELGGNDALRGLPPVQTRTNLDAILERLSSAGVKILLTGMRAPRNLGGDYVAGFDSIFPELARLHQVAFYPFFLDGVATAPTLNQNDGIHPNAKGVDVIVAGILPLVLQMIGSGD